MPNNVERGYIVVAHLTTQLYMPSGDRPQVDCDLYVANYVTEDFDTASCIHYHISAMSLVQLGAMFFAKQSLALIIKDTLSGLMPFAACEILPVQKVTTVIEMVTVMEA